MQQIVSEVMNIFRLEEKVLIYGLLSVGNAFLSCVLTFVLIIGFHQGWYGRLYSLIIVTLILFGISVYLILKKKYVCLKQTFLKKELFKDALNYGLPLIPHSVSWWLKQGSDRFIINYFHGSVAVGLFSFGFNFANILVIISEAFNASYSVTIYKSLSNDENSLVILLKKNYYILMIYFALMLLIILLTAIGIPLFFSEYSGSLLYIYPLCLSAFFQSLYYVFVNFLFFRKKTKILMYITFGSSFLHLCFSVLFTRYTPLFAAYLLLFTNILISICVILYVDYLYKLPWKQAYKLMRYEK